MNTSQLHFWLSFIKDATQILFFLTTGTLAILTYIGAKRTLLQPLRTEVFKEQIKVFAEFLTIFSGKTEMDLRDDYAISELIKINTVRLIDDYALNFFDIEINKERRPYHPSNHPHAVITNPEDIELDDNYVAIENKLNDKEKADPRTRAAIWNKYKYGFITLPTTYVNRKTNLERLNDSPLVPKELSFLINDFLKNLERNVVLVSKILTEVAQELPEKYPTIEKLEQSSLIWIYNKYNNEIVNLEERSKKITDYLRKYFTTDKLFQP